MKNGLILCKLLKIIPIVHIVVIDTLPTFIGLLYRQLCWYLTCDNKNHYSWTRHRRPGADSSKFASNLHSLNHKTLIFVGMILIMMILFLGLVCAIVWICF